MYLRALGTRGYTSKCDLRDLCCLTVLSLFLFLSVSPSLCLSLSLSLSVSGSVSVSLTRCIAVSVCLSLCIRLCLCLCTSCVVFKRTMACLHCMRCAVDRSCCCKHCLKSDNELYFGVLLSNCRSKAGPHNCCCMIQLTCTLYRSIHVGSMDPSVRVGLSGYVCLLICLTVCLSQVS